MAPEIDESDAPLSTSIVIVSDLGDSSSLRSLKGSETDTLITGPIF